MQIIKASFAYRKRLEVSLLTSYLSERVYLSVGFSTVPCGIASGALSALSHDSITVGCWASSGQVPPPTLDKSPFSLSTFQNVGIKKYA